MVLDPFCGCGTTIHAAQKLDRQWIGIDITYLAINLIKRRLKDAFGEEIEFEEKDQPTDFGGARSDSLSSTNSNFNIGPCRSSVRAH